MRRWGISDRKSFADAASLPNRKRSQISNETAKLTLIESWRKKLVSQIRFFVPSFTSFKEGVQHNSLLGQSLWGLRLCEHQEIEAESGRTHFHQFLTCARYYYSPPYRASHSVIIVPAPRYRLETCNILGQAVEPDINTFKERRRWTEEGNNRILLPNNKVLFNFQTSVKLRIHLCSLPMLAAVTMPVQNKQCGRKNQTKPDLPFISPSGGHTVTATAWPPINAATNPRRVMAKIGSGGIQILLENRLSGKPNNKLGVRENKSGKLHRTNPNSPEEKLKSIET